MAPTPDLLVRPTRLLPGTPVAVRSGYGLSSRQSRKARERVGKLALLLAGAAAVGAVMAPTLPGVFGAPMEAVWALLAFNSAGVVVNLALWRLARSARWPDRAVLDAALAWQVAGCLAVNLHVYFFFLSVEGYVAALTPTVLWMVLQPVVVPTPRRRTLVASGLSALTAPLALVLLSAVTTFDVALPRIVDSTFIFTVTAGLAVAASGVVHRLAVDASAAEQLGSYHLQARLGEGGMGEVWRATHGMLARPAAVKLIRPAVLGGEGEGITDLVLRQFEIEARSTALLRSPHTVEVFDFGRAEDGRFYYVMELLDGLDLRTLVQRHGPLPAERVVFLLQQVAHSLDEAHAAGLVHRDIKPANLFLCRYGRDHDFVKVLDFGLVRARGEAQAGPEAGTTMGTPAFMAPEAAGGHVDARSDLYALGRAAWLLLTGELVFGESGPMESIARHQNQRPRPPSELASVDVPVQLDELVLACLQKEPGDRPQDARALLRLLARVPLRAPWTEERAADWWQTHEHGAGPGAARTPSREQLAPTIDLPDPPAG